MSPVISTAIMADNGRTEHSADARLLILLHGYGSHEGDLIELAPWLPDDLTMAAMRAPIDLGEGYSWMNVQGSPQQLIAGGIAAAEAVLEWLDVFIASWGTPVGTSLLGFSQGAAVSTELLRLAPDRFEAAVILSGMSLAGDRSGDAALAARRPPVFWGRDLEDPVIPEAFIDQTLIWLPEHSTLTERLYTGIGHGVSSAEMADVSAFLTAARSV
jgi:phospholipase/carboxylesterase